MTAKEHVQEICKCGAEHEMKVAKCHVEAADRHDARAKDLEVSDPSGSVFHKGEADWHRAKAADLHTSHGEKLLAMHKSAGEIPDEAGGPTEKVQGDDLKALAAQVSSLVKFLGDNAGRVSPNPRSPAPRPTLAPRFGQADPRVDAISKMDPALKHLVDDSSEAAT